MRIIVFDWASIEKKMAKDAELMREQEYERLGLTETAKQYQDCHDIHKLYACKITGKRPEEITDAIRRDAKNALYGQLYSSISSLADRLRVLSPTRPGGQDSKSRKHQRHSFL